MAKRRRLTPARSGWLAAEVDDSLPGRGPDLGAGPGTAPPIARVAGEASAAAALAEVSEAMAAARAEGRLVQRLPLAAIEVDHLVRDRLETDEEELEGLMSSLAAHGQRSPVDVTELAPGRYGLISGWRRLTALSRLHARTGEPRFAEALALVRRPESAADAYVAMVEENEVRLGLSYYERARIAARAVDLGVFSTEKTALQTLFAAASRARRSKIGSFLRLVRAFDGVLGFPAAIPERLGLGLAKLVESDPAATAALAADLAACPAADATEELARLAAAAGAEAKTEQALVAHPALPSAPRRPAPAPPRRRPPGEPVPPSPAGEELRPGLFLVTAGDPGHPVVTLSGPAVDPQFCRRLEAWLRNDR